MGRRKAFKIGPHQVIAGREKADAIPAVLTCDGDAVSLQGACGERDGDPGELLPRAGDRADQLCGRSLLCERGKRSQQHESDQQFFHDVSP